MEKDSITLTRNQAVVISAYLDALRRLNDSPLLDNQGIQKMEDVLDVQIWGEQWVAKRNKEGDQS